MGDKPPYNYPRMSMQKKSSLSKLNLEPTAKGSVLKSDKINYSFIYILRLALLVATCPSEMDSLFLIHSLYTEPTGEGRFLTIVYAHQFFTPCLHTRLPYGRRGSGLANWFAYNMAITRWIVATKLIIFCIYIKGD